MSNTIIDRCDLDADRSWTNRRQLRLRAGPLVVQHWRLRAATALDAIADATQRD